MPLKTAEPRLYVGIASQGRNPKVLMRRLQRALMGAAVLAWHEAGGERRFEGRDVVATRFVRG